MWQIAAGLLVLLLGFRFLRSSPETAEHIDPWKIPDTLSGLSLLQYLQKIENSNSIQDEALVKQLQDDIRIVESAFFSGDTDSQPVEIDLGLMANDWNQRVNRPK